MKKSKEYIIKVLKNIFKEKYIDERLLETKDDIFKNAEDVFNVLYNASYICKKNKNICSLENTKVIIENAYYSELIKLSVMERKRFIDKKYNQILAYKNNYYSITFNAVLYNVIKKINNDILNGKIKNIESLDEKEKELSEEIGDLKNKYFDEIVKLHKKELAFEDVVNLISESIVKKLISI